MITNTSLKSAFDTSSISKHIQVLSCINSKTKQNKKNLGARSCKTCSRNASVVNGFQGVAVQLLMCFRVVVGVVWMLVCSGIVVMVYFQDCIISMSLARAFSCFIIKYDLFFVA